jgi:hypothetical protein
VNTALRLRQIRLKKFIYFLPLRAVVASPTWQHNFAMKCNECHHLSQDSQTTCPCCGSPFPSAHLTRKRWMEMFWLVVSITIIFFLTRSK